VASQSTKVARSESLCKNLRRPHYLLAKGLGDFPTIDLEAHDQLSLVFRARKGRATGVVETIDPLVKKDGAAD